MSESALKAFSLLIKSGKSDKNTPRMKNLNIALIGVLSLTLASSSLIGCSSAPKMAPLSLSEREKAEKEIDAQVNRTLADFAGQYAVDLFERVITCAAEGEKNLLVQAMVDFANTNYQLAVKATADNLQTEVAYELKKGEVDAFVSYAIHNPGQFHLNPSLIATRFESELKASVATYDYTSTTAVQDANKTVQHIAYSIKGTSPEEMHLLQDHIAKVTFADASVPYKVRLEQGRELLKAFNTYYYYTGDFLINMNTCFKAKGLSAEAVNNMRQLYTSIATRTQKIYYSYGSDKQGAYNFTIGCGAQGEVVNWTSNTLNFTAPTTTDLTSKAMIRSGELGDHCDLIPTAIADKSKYYAEHPDQFNYQTCVRGPL